MARAKILTLGGWAAGCDFALSIIITKVLEKLKTLETIIFIVRGR